MQCSTFSPTITLEVVMTNLIWNDPDYIEGNDYRITSMEVINDEMALIQYNQGQSEAEVFLCEIVTL